LLQSSNGKSFKQGSRTCRLIIRPHRMHAVHRCGLLLRMSHVAWSVCVCVCWARGWAMYKKRLNRSWARLRGWLMWVHGTMYCGRVYSPPRGVTSRQCGLLPNDFGHFVFYLVYDQIHSPNPIKLEHAKFHLDRFRGGSSGEASERFGGLNPSPH